MNVGVWHGFSLLAAMAGNGDKVCVGVTTFRSSAVLGRIPPALPGQPLAEAPLYNQDYEDFFAAGLERPLGAYFYDGDHRMSTSTAA